MYGALIMNIGEKVKVKEKSIELELQREKQE